MSKKTVFENLSKTKPLADGFTMLDAIKARINRPKECRPSQELPSLKTDLKNYYSKDPSIIWFGHSSYLIHADGKNILVDPVLSGHASPFRFMIKAFGGSDIYKTADMPRIDYLILTHNHYDHLDYKALKALMAQTAHIVHPREVHADLKGIDTGKKMVTELGWWESAELEENISIACTPAKHFSGRGIKRNGSLWASYVLTINGCRIFIGGDSGYDSHFKMIGDKYGPIDIALLECGQYDKMWPEIHSMPEDLPREALELQASVIMPVHWGKFALANHAWDEPVKRFVIAAAQQNIAYTTPMIGEPVVLGKNYPRSAWWDK